MFIQERGYKEVLGEVLVRLDAPYAVVQSGSESPVWSLPLAGALLACDCLKLESILSPRVKSAGMLPRNV